MSHPSDHSEEVAALWPKLESLAKTLSRVSYLAEADDLIQEGALAVWLQLRKGPVTEGYAVMVAKNAMRDWVRYVTHGGRVEASVPG